MRRTYLRTFLSEKTSDDVSQVRRAMFRKMSGDVSKSVKMSLLKTSLRLFQKRLVTFLKCVRSGDVSKKRLVTFLKTSGDVSSRRNVNSNPS